MRTSHLLNPYSTSIGANSTTVRPSAGTFTLRVAIALPLTTSDTVFSAAGVPKPATTACTRDRFGSLGSASSTGALTLSTVQLGDAAPFATSWSTSVTFGGNIISAKFAGMA